MNAVGADDRVAGHIRHAAGKTQRCARVILHKTGRGTAEVDRVRLEGQHRVEQDFVKVAAVDHPIRRAETLDTVTAEIEQLPGLPRVP